MTYPHGARSNNVSTGKASDARWNAASESTGARAAVRLSPKESENCVACFVWRAEIGTMAGRIQELERALGDGGADELAHFDRSNDVIAALQDEGGVGNP